MLFDIFATLPGRACLFAALAAGLNLAAGNAGNAIALAALTAAGLVGLRIAARLDQRRAVQARLRRIVAEAGRPLNQTH